MLTWAHMSRAGFYSFDAKGEELAVRGGFEPPVAFWTTAL